MASGALVELCKESLGWKKSTTYTVLKKMCEKGFAKNEDAVVTALIPREQVQAFESEHFVERAFDGSLPGFLAPPPGFHICAQAPRFGHAAPGLHSQSAPSSIRRRSVRNGPHPQTAGDPGRTHRPHP